MYASLETFCKDIAGDEKPLMLEFVWARLVSHYKDSPFQRSLLRRYSHTGEEIWQGIADLFSMRVTVLVKRRKNSTVWVPRGTEARYETHLWLDPNTFLIETILPKAPVMSLLHLMYSIETSLPEVTFRTLLVNHLLSPQTRFRYICNANDDYLLDVIRQHVDIMENSVGEREKRIFDYMVDTLTRSISFRAVFRPKPEDVVLTDEDKAYYQKRHKEWKRKVFSESPTPP